MDAINSIVIIGIVSVFIILALLYILFSFMEIILKKIYGDKPSKIISLRNNASEEEIVAAITSIHLYMNYQDQEKAILTIQKKEKSYSPWSSKIYSIYNNIIYKK